MSADLPVRAKHMRADCDPRVDRRVAITQQTRSIRFHPVPRSLLEFDRPSSSETIVILNIVIVFPQIQLVCGDSARDDFLVSTLSQTSE